MKNNKKSIFWLLLTGSITVFGIFSFVSQPSVLAAAPKDVLDVSQSVSVQRLNDDQSTSEDTQGVATSVLKQQVQGLDIEITSYERANEFLFVNLCFQLPNDADWLLSRYPEDVALTIAGKTILHSGFAEIDTKVDSKGNKTHRCDKVTFMIDPQEDLQNFTLTVYGLSTSMPEILDCDKAQAKLDKKASGVKIKCKNNSYEVVDKPSTLNPKDLLKEVEGAFVESIEGPWVFEVYVP